jgi:hypothetical protein
MAPETHSLVSVPDARSFHERLASLEDYMGAPDSDDALSLMVQMRQISETLEAIKGRSKRPRSV